MLEEIVKFLTWLLTTTGPTLAVLTLIGVLFREKWKQILAKSLTQEVELLKHELVKKQADHAASLTPQLEAVRHDFQQKLEAYKVSLIAQAEAAKLRGDVRKTIAAKYEQVQFDRLIQLETDLSRAGTFLLGVVTYSDAIRTQEQFTKAIEVQETFAESWTLAELFLPTDLNMKLADLRVAFANFLDHIGPGKPPLQKGEESWSKVLSMQINAKSHLQEIIKAQAKI